MIPAPQKPVKDLLFNPTFSDIGYLTNSLLSMGLSTGGFLYAVTGSGENHIRDGIIAFTAGRVLSHGNDALQYLKAMYHQQK